jgi:hypothetical protein
MAKIRLIISRLARIGSNWKNLPHGVGMEGGATILECSSTISLKAK